MLQINSGKLYPNGVGRTNELRGILYSNLVLAGLDNTPIVTVAGTLMQVDPWGGPQPLVYELTERMEGGAKASRVLISHGVQPYLHDFAAVVSFVLQATCTPDFELCSRLLSAKRSLGVMTPPDKLVKRVFDKSIWIKPLDCSALVDFVADLIGLQRKSFLAAMRAIRTYVTGLHRVTDDLELAYALLVASIESLAQDFDGHVGRWSDYEESRRRRIDDALSDADQDIAARVRAAVMENEHLALGRRFRDFALDHLPASYFREAGRVGAPGRLDLRDGLREAYALRSRYVHNLRDLPHLLDADLRYSEAIRHDHRILLTLEGLSRVAHRVISEFVSRQPKVEHESYDSGLERYGIVQVQLAPEYWIGQPEALAPEMGRQWLEGFLQQFAAHLLSRTPITGLGAVLLRIEELLPRSADAQSPSLAAVYCLYNNVVPPGSRSPNYRETINRHSDVLAAPNVEALVVHLLLDREPDWDLEQHQALLNLYFAQRNQRLGFRAPDLFEAGFVIALAERHRRVGAAEKAADLLSFAADNLPAFPALASLAVQFDAATPIDWGILIPRPPQTTAAATAFETRNNQPDDEQKAVRPE